MVAMNSSRRWLLSIVGKAVAEQVFRRVILVISEWDDIDVQSFTTAWRKEYLLFGMNYSNNYIQATTGRPGARFGPGGIRLGSRRIHPGGYSVYTGKLKQFP